MEPILYRITRPIINILFKIFFRPTYIGLENIPDKGSVVLAGNHTNNLDCILLITSTKRTIHFLAKDELLKGGKKIIFKIYDLFGKLSDFKLHEEIFSNDSPLQFIYAIPDVLAVYIRFNISVPKSQTQKWFEENYL